MPIHHIIQRQQELIRGLNSLTENYEKDVKQAADVAARANETAEMERRRKIQEPDALIGRIRQLEYNIRSSRKLKPIHSAKASSPNAILATGVDPVRQLQIYLSKAENISKKYTKIRKFIVLRIIINLFVIGLSSITIVISLAILLYANSYLNTNAEGILVAVFYIIIIIGILILIVFINLRFRSLYASIFHVLSTAEELYQQQKQAVDIAYQHRVEQNQQYHYHEQVKKLDQIMSEKIAELHAKHTKLVLETRFSGAEWSDTAIWKQWQPPKTATPVARLGTLTIRFRKESLDPLPLFVSCPGGENLLFKAKGNAVQTATGSIQSLILRLLTTQPPGRVRFTFIDPVQFGQSVEAFTQLAQYDPALITHRVWTEQAQIEQQLAELSEYMAHIIQNKLQGRYPTIEEYNERSGQAPVPYRVLVVFGFPTNFAPQTVHRLVSIAKNGARCGLSTIVVLEEDAPQARGFNATDLEQVSTVIAWDGKRFLWSGVDMGKQLASATVSYSAEIDV